MALKQALEIKDKEFKAVVSKNNILQLDLEKVQTNERKLKAQVSSLEAQVCTADLGIIQNVKTFSLLIS